LKLKNLLKSDDPSPEEMALTPVFATYHKFLVAHAFRVKSRKNMTVSFDFLSDTKPFSFVYQRS